MSEEFKRAGLLLRTVAKILDFIIIAAAAEVLPKAGFYAGLAYLLIGDGLFDGRSLGKKIVGLRVVSAVLITLFLQRFHTQKQHIWYWVSFLQDTLVWMDIYQCLLLLLNLLSCWGARTACVLATKLQKQGCG